MNFHGFMIINFWAVMVSTAWKKVNRHGEITKGHACLSTTEFQKMGKWELSHPQLSMMLPIIFKLVMTLY